MTIDTIKNNELNRLWFKSAGCFGDEKYEIIRDEDATEGVALKVTCKPYGEPHRVVYYNLEGSRITTVLRH